MYEIATYNVNGISGRLPVLLLWLDETQPDVACLQELKAPDEKFPLQAIKDAGYTPFGTDRKAGTVLPYYQAAEIYRKLRKGLPCDPDDTHSRYIKAMIDDVVIGCLYLPNGNPAPGPKLDYKMQWFDRLTTHAESLLKQGLPVVLCGDYNVMPTEQDVYKAERWVDDALFRPEVREAFQKLVAQGWTDAIRKLYPTETIYTFFDYFRDAYGRNVGLRIDHFLLNLQTSARLRAAAVDRHVRGWEKSSDHCPVWIELGD